jgi:predicted nucleotidyltransferase
MAIDPRLHGIAMRQPHPLLFATISGAHLYGFPSPDSDYDLRGVHILPLGRIVGLDPGPATISARSVASVADVHMELQSVF